MVHSSPIGHPGRMEATVQTSVHPAAAPSLPAAPRDLGREMFVADL